MNSKSGKTEEVITACRSHCGSTCMLKINIREGVIISIEPYEREHLSRPCARGRAYRQRVYAQDRILHPMRRTGPRGKGEFERVSWDEALGNVAGEIKRVSKEYGPSAVAFMCSAADIAWLHNGGLIDRLLVRAGGYSGVWGTVSAEGAWFASMATYGTDNSGLVNSRESLRKSRMIVLWGCDPATTRGYGDILGCLTRAREDGTRIVVIDPRYTDSAAVFADQWIPIRPGTDTALLASMAYVLISENLLDQAFIDTYTVGYERFRDYVIGEEDGIPKTPAWAENITGVPTHTIIELSREYALAKPAALIDGFAPGRTAHGELFHRAIAALCAMTGNIGIIGGSAGGGFMGTHIPGVSLGSLVPSRMKGGENPIDASAPPRKDSVFYQKRDSVGLSGATFYSGGAGSSKVHRIHLADAILRGRKGGYPADYKLLYLSNINYVNQYASTNKIIEALNKLEYVVVQEQFMTATAKYADIILPTNTYLERNDITTGGLAPFLGYMNKVVDSIGESKSHFEIACELASKLGISDFSEKNEEGWIRELVEQCRHIPDYNRFKKSGIHEVKLPKSYVAFEEQIKDPEKKPFNTPSGKIELYSEQIATMGNPLLPPVPKYIETWESRNDPLAQKYPLQLITSHPKRRAHSQYENIPWLRELCLNEMWINPIDANARGITTGDEVRVINDRGRLIIRAKVTGRIMPGVVNILEGGWFNPDSMGVDKGGCVNVLTNDIISPGGAFCSNTCLVQVKKLSLAST